MLVIHHPTCAAITHTSCSVFILRVYQLKQIEGSQSQTTQYDISIEITNYEPYQDLVTNDDSGWQQSWSNLPKKRPPDRARMGGLSRAVNFPFKAAYLMLSWSLIINIKLNTCWCFLGVEWWARNVLWLGRWSISVGWTALSTLDTMEVYAATTEQFMLI